jgi:hypothetical protein
MVSRLFLHGILSLICRSVLGLTAKWLRTRAIVLCNHLDNLNLDLPCSQLALIMD